MATLFSAMRMALTAVVRNKLRAGLTVLGILIGVAAVVVTTALGAGAERRITGQIDKLGSNTMLVFPQANQASGARAAQGTSGRLTDQDVKALATSNTSIAGAAPFLRTNAQVVFEDRNVATQIFGTTRAYFAVRAWTVGDGETWSAAAEQSGERVCIVGTTVATSLFGGFDPIGRVVRIGRYPFRVLGVLEPKGQSPFGTDQDDVVMTPLSTFRGHIQSGNRKNLHGIVLAAASADTNDRAKSQAESILRERHHLGDTQDPDFVIRTQAEFRASQQMIYGTLSTLLLSVGAVSLLVGGIGIMNIMLVSVAERTREIGIRMAIGAREGDIQVQFLVEAIVLASLGGISGVVVGFILVPIIGALRDATMSVSPVAVTLSVVVSAFTGVVFGFFPARRAARLDPIEALRRE
jgi:putative ABC transport system permease protein